MSKFLALVKKELLLLLRDPHGLLVLFAMPMVFILIMSLAMRDTIDPQRAASIEFIVHNQSGELPATKLISALGELPGFRRVEAAADQDRAQIQAQLADDAYKLAVLVPADFAERLRRWEGEGAAAPVEVLLSPAVSPQTRLLFELALTQTLHKLRLETVVFPAMGLPGLNGGELLVPALELSGEYVFRDARPQTTPTAVQQSVPAYLVFGMFFVVIPLATAFLVERQQGSLVRLQVMNVRPGLLLAAKIVPYYLVNQLQMLLMLLVGMYLVPRLGGDALNAPGSWGGLLLISSATSLAAIGFALMVAAIARSSNEATTLGGGSNIVLAALGGVMVPKFVMPQFMQEATAVSPMSWGLEGFLDVFLRGGAWQEVLTEVGALALFGALCLIAASLLFRRQIRGLA
jgi:ABC-2 type transport system permease protein